MTFQPSRILKKIVASVLHARQSKTFKDAHPFSNNTPELMFLVGPIGN